MAELFAVSLAALEGNENEFIIYSEGSRAIDQYNGQRCLRTFVCVCGIRQKEKVAAPAKANTCVELKSLQSKSN